jgi:hypothetical protein
MKTGGKKKSSKGKSNNHRLDCGCPICKNMKKGKKGGADEEESSSGLSSSSSSMSGLDKDTDSNSDLAVDTMKAGRRTRRKSRKSKKSKKSKKTRKSRKSRRR